ncbi:MAG: pyridoxamine 5'-phosphate oxidase family protein [Proteobacteria bacterium]|nr:pyridoxamine 5'-phosphate oxidase family protein [Pseudomonadota bacterium]
MNLDKYFTDTTGTGVFASANREGEVNTAIFSRPHIAEDGRMVFIMGDNRTHENLQTNPHASFLFLEAGPGYRGSRFYLTKTAEEENDELVRELCRRCKEVNNPDSMRKRYVVYFNIDKELPLIGAGE